MNKLIREENKYTGKRLKIIQRIYEREDGLNYISIMFNFNNEIISTESIYLISTHFVLFIIAIIGCTPIFKKIKEKLKNNKIFMIIEIIICLVLFFISLSFLVGSTYNPFLYFRF